MGVYLLSNSLHTNDQDFFSDQMIVYLNCYNLNFGLIQINLMFITWILAQSSLFNSQDRGPRQTHFTQS